MNIPYKVICAECVREYDADVKLHDNSPDFICPLGHRMSGFFDLDFTAGFRLLLRSQRELIDRSDYSMSIILAAMSMESEVSRLFWKWLHIDSLGRGESMQEQEVEGMLRKFPNIADRISRVARLMYSAGMDAFVAGSAEFKDLQVRFPSLRIGCLPQCFQESVFWPRNRIVHFGYSQYTREDAARIHSIANMGLAILKALDYERRKPLM